MTEAKTEQPETGMFSPAWRRFKKFSAWLANFQAGVLLYLTYFTAGLVSALGFWITGRNREFFPKNPWRTRAPQAQDPEWARHQYLKR